MKKYLKYVLLLGAVALIVIGVQAGEPETVLQKGIRICLECIGVG